MQLRPCFFGRICHFLKTKVHLHTRQMCPTLQSDGISSFPFWREAAIAKTTEQPVTRGKYVEKKLCKYASKYNLQADITTSSLKVDFEVFRKHLFVIM
jgi:hypothetical protein